MRKRNLTITEAAELTGLTRKAMARRVERGSVRSVLRSGRRLIPRSELVRAGLLPAEGESGVLRAGELDLERAAALPQGARDGSLVGVLVRELVELVQRQGDELARYRALTVEAESLRLEREIAELRVRLSIVEGGEGRRALGPGTEPEDRLSRQTAGDSSERQTAATQTSTGLWLPPSVQPTARTAAPASMARWPASTQPRLGFPHGRMLSLAVEILFIGVVACLAWLADVGPVFAAGAVAIAWLVAATFEVARWLRH